MRGRVRLALVWHRSPMAWEPWGGIALLEMVKKVLNRM